MNLRQYLAALGASTIVWLIGQLAVLFLIPVFEVIGKLPISHLMGWYLISTLYWLFQGTLAFYTTLIATNLLPLSAQKFGSCVFATSGLALIIWLSVAIFNHFKRFPHPHRIIYDTITDPFVFYFFVGAFFCVLHVFLRKPVEPLITLR
jgi:hypothetical protein